MDTNKARSNFIALCQRVKDAKTEIDFKEEQVKAQFYSQAIQDICGLSIWANIVMETDMVIGEDDTPVCAGIPLLFKKAD
jgi:hypothetical protein